MPRYLGANDYPWLQGLLQLYGQLEGMRRAELDARFRGGLPVSGPVESVQRARHVLDRACASEGIPPKEAAQLREALFVAAASRRKMRQQLLADMASEQGKTSRELLESLFADLPSERKVAAVPSELNHIELALRVNLALVQGICARSVSMTIDLWGNARAIVRLAQLRGLLCTARPLSDLDGGEGAAVRLELSGPLSLFRQTRMYGRALSSLVPQLCWCQRFELKVVLPRSERRVEVSVVSGAPIFPSKAPKPFDSKLEERFARDFTRLAPDWTLVREPAPVQAEGRLIFPDFAIQHRRDSTRRALLEIAGFWTANYLQDKLRHLRAAGIPGLILCIDARRDCGEEVLPDNARVIRYRRRIDAEQVLELLGAL